MKRRRFLQKSLEGIVLASTPLISSSVESGVKSDLNSNSIIRDDIEYYMQTDRYIYNLGENVETLYRVTNFGDEDVMFVFPNGPKERQCAFTVDKDGEIIWDTRNLPITPAFTYFILKSSQSKEYTEKWNMVVPTKIGYVPAYVGAYTVTGALDGLWLGYEERHVPVPVNINIGETYVEDEKPNEFSLYQNYPNPFNPYTTIEYSLPEKSNVRLNVYNVRGQKVKTLVDKAQIPGQYKVDFNARDLSSGLYFTRLETSQGVKTRKIMLVK